MQLKLNPHLKQDETGAIAMKTFVGMAHFAGSGPKGKTCRQCLFYGNEGYKKTNKELKASSCSKGLGGKFPHSAMACKYFDENRDAPAPFLKETHGN